VQNTNKNIPPLFKHQEDMVRFLVARGGTGALFADMGVGKTRAVIEAYSQLRSATPGLKMLVVAPLSLLEAAWGCDVCKFSNFVVRNLHNEGIPTEWISDIWVINYESFIAKKNYAPLYKLMGVHPVMLVVDESSRMKNPNAITTKLLLQMRHRAKYRVIMSGTPAPNTPMEYWGQMEFVKRDSLNPSFYAFRNIYFHLARSNQIANLRGQVVTREAMRSMLMKGFKYEITPENQRILMERIKPYAYWVKKEDCLALPEQIDENRIVELTQKQRSIYNEMKRHLITEIGGKDVVAQVALTKLVKLRQIISGFAFDMNGKEQEIGESSKLKESKNIAEEIGKRPVIFWATFKWEIEQLVKILSEFGSVLTLYSDTKDHDDSISRFQNGDAQYLVAHGRSAAHGLTFTNCSYEVFFSIDYSFEMYEQQRARIHRAGQKNKCTYLHLLAKDTIDEDMYDVIKKKASVEEVIYRLIKKHDKK
jgi:SNF2 family DNA or RNA helicase